MTDHPLCCLKLDRLASAPSPFDRLIALGQNDGPTGGLIRCGRCGREYAFDLLDESFEPEGSDLRVYSLAPLPGGPMARFAEVFPCDQTPIIPVWVPRWEFATKSQRAEMDDLVE